jgi:ribonuclease D
MPFDRVSATAQVVRGDLTTEQAEALARCSLVACDTETSGLDWRTDRLSLCQFFAPAVGAILVQATNDIPHRVVGLLEDERVGKVFHHAPFDLRFLRKAWSAETRSVYCTKIASKLLDPNAPNSEHSLQALYAKYLNVQIEKGAVRTSNWSSNLLTSEQVRYASADVAGLLELWDVLSERLDRVGKSKLYADCCAFLPAQSQLTLEDYPDVFAY